MGFTVQFVLGTFLVLLCCASIQNTQIQDGEEAVEKLQKNETEKVTEANLAEDNKPKTDSSTEDSKQSSVRKKEEIGRSIDIEKYVSKEFHNKNNVYTLPISPDTEKYIDPDYDFHATTPNHQEHNTEVFNFESELTTPKSPIFDPKYKEAVESVDQKLEHIDDSHEISGESESKENLNLEKLYNETKKNDTKADLDYINYKNIISNDTGSKNSLHKNVVLESGTNLNFQSSYNHTAVIDENDSGNNTIVKEPDGQTSTLSNLIPVKGDLDKTESSTIKNIILTTRKSIVLTKPPSNKNSSLISILSNNIETETVKAINPTTEKTKGDKETASEVYTKRAPIDITKRGSIKFAHTLSTQPTVITNNINKKSEQLLQENQVIPVHVEAPPTTKNSTTEAALITESTTKAPETETRVTYSIETKIKTVSIETATTEIEPETTTPLSVETTETTESTQSTEAETENATTENVPSTPTTPLEEETTPWEELTTFPSTFLSDSTAATTPETTTEITTLFNASEDFPKNVTITTENTVRTSKGLVFKLSTTETVPTVIMTTEKIEPTTKLSPRIFSKATVETTTSYETTEAKTELETTTMTVGVNNSTNIVPEFKSVTNDSTEETTENHTITSDSYELNTGNPEENGGTIAAIAISSIGAVCLIVVAGFLVIMRKRQKRFNYGQRCRPVNLDDYSMDNVSVYNSVRRKGMLRGSKRSYGNPAFEDPASVSHPLNFPALGKFANNMEDMKAEFEEIPQITARTNELPEGCDTKNRYANVIPLPETRVFLSLIDGYPNSDYINANYVTGPKNIKGYYIACQAPMQNTVDDFWRMVWEQQCKVILMLTHLFENGVEKCVDYLPPSEVLDCHRLFGDFQVTLKKREVKDKYIISSLQLKNMVSNSWREVTHFWYLAWPEKGVPSEANSLIAFLIEARSYMKSSSLDRKEVTNGNLANGGAKNEVNPVVVHCSPGTGRTGVVIACDIAIREFEQNRLVDVPRIVYKIRRDRASAVQTKEQYAFIYKVINLYATKLTGGALDSI